MNPKILVRIPKSACGRCDAYAKVEKYVKFYSLILTSFPTLRGSDSAHKRLIGPKPTITYRLSGIDYTVFHFFPKQYQVKDNYFDQVQSKFIIPALIFPKADVMKII